MSASAFYKRFVLNDELIQETGFNPYYKKLQTGLGDKLKINDSEYIDLASNNYLGIANNKQIKKAVNKAVDKYGVSLCGTPIASGYSDLYEELACEISDFVGLDDTIIYPSCYQANNGLFSAIVGREDVVIVDQYAHSSLIEGIRAVGCKIRPFLHNNLAHLEKNLKNSTKYRQVFVVTESVFSTEGSIAPFKEIVALCDKYNAIPIVDDSHGIGVLGATGKGILEHEELSDYNGIYTASLGKAIANIGGVICGKKSLINYLRYYSSHLVYSTALPPHILAGIKEALHIIDTNFEAISSALWSNYNTLKTALCKLNYSLSNSQAPIVSVKTFEADNTLAFAHKLFANGVLCTPFVYPSVSKNEGVIRLIAGANISNNSMRKVIEVFEKIK